MMEKCGICKASDAKYKCPKCGVKYCSLICYKDVAKHQDPAGSGGDEQAYHDEAKSQPPSTAKNPLGSPKWSKIFSEAPELQELLQYNTVKFHLSKVYRILNSEAADSNESMNSEMKRQLAVDYLNTLRYGGIHYNEAIEEFCQISLERLKEKQI